MSIYLYNYINGKLSPNIIHKFASINKLSQYSGVSRETISIYLNTNVPVIKKKIYFFFITAVIYF